MATVAIKQVKKRVFKWNNEMVENLIDAISNYKSQMSYRGIDFDGDKPLMYKHLRDDMAKFLRRKFFFLKRLLMISLMWCSFCKIRNNIILLMCIK